MTCAEAYERLLEADLNTARPAGGGLPAELEAHVRRCPACRASHETLLEANEVLRLWLWNAPAVDAPALVEAAGAGSGPESAPVADSSRPAVSDPGRDPARRRGPFRRRSWLSGAGLAAAAVVVALVLTRPFTTTTVDPESVPGSAPESGGPSWTGFDPARLAVTQRQPAIAIPEGRNAAILDTNDPNITIIWFYGGDR